MAITRLKIANFANLTLVFPTKPTIANKMVQFLSRKND